MQSSSTNCAEKACNQKVSCSIDFDIIWYNIIANCKEFQNTYPSTIWFVVSQFRHAIISNYLLIETYFGPC